MSIFCLLLDIKIFWQDVVCFCLVWAGFPSLVSCLFLPELQLCRETAYAQIGKGVIREQYLSQKAELLFHLSNLFFIGKSIR